jgi:quercetin dioxygenase-like cupin family protein
MLNTLKSSLLLVAFVAFAQQPSVVQITSEPSHHLVFQNEWVRAFNVIAPVKTTTLVHQHNYDYFSVALGDADIINNKVGEKPAPQLLRDGQVRFVKGGFAHSVTNNSSDHPFHNSTIELLQPSTGAHACTESCTIPLPCGSADKAACPTAEILYLSDQWRMISVLLPPGAKYAEHTHTTPHLAVAVSDFDIRQKIKGGAETTIHGAVGDVKWIPPVVHSLTNVGTQPARLMTLEFTNQPAITPDHVHP